MCYGALILGHGNSEVFSAISEQFSNIGTPIFGTPHHFEIDMARTLTEIFPSIEKVRLTNSGLEATLLALRYATAWTQRKKIAKFEGHYHGSHDQVLISVNPETRQADQPPAVTCD